MNPAQAVRLVAGREFSSRYRDRGFLISTGILVAIISVILVIANLTANDAPDRYNVAIIGPGSEAVATSAQALTTQAGADLRLADIPDRDTAVSQVRSGRLDAALVLDPGGSAEVVADRGLPPTLAAVLQVSADQASRAALLQQAGVSGSQAQQILDAGSRVQTTELNPQSDTARANENIAALASFLLYGQLLTYGLWVAFGVTEEKSSRVVEVLLATIRPLQLLTGKIFGIGALGLAQVSLLAVVGLGGAAALSLIDLRASAVLTVAGVIVWFVLGYAFFASLYAAVASTVSRQEELQNATTPLTFLVVGSFIASVIARGSPDGAFARVASFVPPISALVMPPRAAVGNVAAWQIVASMLVMVAAAVLVARLGGRLYAGAVLRIGARVPLREALRAGRS